MFKYVYNTTINNYLCTTLEYTGSMVNYNKVTVIILRSKNLHEKEISKKIYVTMHSLNWDKHACETSREKSRNY